MIPIAIPAFCAVVVPDSDSALSPFPPEPPASVVLDVVLMSESEVKFRVNLCS